VLHQAHSDLQFDSTGVNAGSGAVWTLTQVTQMSQMQILEAPACMVTRTAMTQACGQEVRSSRNGECARGVHSWRE
jgi:hypothetical protein